MKTSLTDHQRVLLNIYGDHLINSHVTSIIDALCIMGASYKEIRFFLQNCKLDEDFVGSHNISYSTGYIKILVPKL